MDYCPRRMMGPVLSLLKSAPWSRKLKESQRGPRWSKVVQSSPTCHPSAVTCSLRNCYSLHGTWAGGTECTRRLTCTFQLKSVPLVHLSARAPDSSKAVHAHHTTPPARQCTPEFPALTPPSFPSSHSTTVTNTVSVTHSTTSSCCIRRPRPTTLQGTDLSNPPYTRTESCWPTADQPSLRTPEVHAANWPVELKAARALAWHELQPARLGTWPSRSEASFPRGEN